MAITKATASSVAPAAAGDLVYGSGTNDAAVLALGTAGQVLKVNSGATAPEWGSASAADNFTLLNTGGTALTGAATVTVSGISGINTLMLVVTAAGTSVSGGLVGFRFNADTGSNYRNGGGYVNSSSGTISINRDGGTSTLASLAQFDSSSSGQIDGSLILHGCNAAGVKPYISLGGVNPTSGNNARNYSIGGVYLGTSTISSVSVYTTAGDLNAGTLYVYGSN